MQKSLGEIAELVGGILEGDPSVLITGASGIKDAGPGDITFLANPKYLPLLPTTKASAIIVGPDTVVNDKHVIRTVNPYLAFTEVLKLFAVHTPVPRGIHPTVVRGRDVFLSEDVALHAGVVLEDGCKVGPRSVLYAGVCVGRNAEIGTDCIVYSRVVIGENVRIGNNAIIHIGAVIGNNPVPVQEAARNEDAGRKGAVVIEDDVEVGANVTVDGSRKGTTVIGRGTKIDNLVHIGSDAQVGPNCIIVSHARIGAGCKLGDGVTIAGQASIFDGVTIGDGTIVAARSGVTEDIGPGQVVSGFPAASHDKQLRIWASMKRLPAIVRDIRDLEKRLDTMEHKTSAETKDH
ncbi:MAG: UDP-3-O-(3-hydroxymyristoyl)glucosamine N-acyltransferase [Candidatus Abyssobacteria bacterium SURF_17]|jgi:UDP-3-O-[3-hydroxymyristoyl] glucosamine N-acyltransferase|uniref:UDP-3-O-(3-hydroxymyristoyl)glucosamine N-acyltransferase n=1 Tax=Candidatus Abyssobacteria bacterium SURF_17 TaxID=2093361 RepID=A0A419F7Z0_9BACT|nr:MAG: UDP-3-O-(3-hydroxymyristoyl)glucosamine N-acyltransferase [Candidatus Abyssubacteria bacterium SURF_17]